MKTNVTATSIAAYHTTDRSRQLDRVARAILRRTEAGQRSWDRIIGAEVGIVPSQVSARRDEMKAGIVLDGIRYRILESGKAKDPQTKKTINTYGLVLAGDNIQLSIV